MGERTRPHNLNIIIIYRGNLGNPRGSPYAESRRNGHWGLLSAIVIGSKRKTDYN